MRPQARREKILDLLRASERCSVDDLAQALDVSRESIRRDLTDLAERGMVRKFHGGAALPESEHEGGFQLRMSQNTAAKRSIARRAAGLFEPGDAVFIDTGTTTLLFAEELARRSGVTVITNSVSIAKRVTNGTGANRAFVIGGEYFPDADEMLGTLALEQIRRFHPVHAVLTVGTVSLDGVMDYDLNEAEVARAMLAQARSLTVLADSSKFGRSALFQVCPLSSIDRLVTDAPPDTALLRALEAENVELLLTRGPFAD